MEIFFFQMENKLQIAEAIVFYHVMIKKAVMLDNFCKGLEVLGVLEEIKKNPSQFESVFIHNEEELTTSAVLAKVLYQPEVPKLKCRFEAFIQDLSKPGNYIVIIIITLINHFCVVLMHMCYCHIQSIILWKHS